MNKGWIWSSIASVVIIVAGIGSLSYINRTVPTQLPNKPLLAGTTTTTATQSTTGNKALKDIIFNTQKKVVMIELEDGSLGSGFLYNQQGDIITNAHVVAGAVNVKVKTADARTLAGKVIGIGTDMDIAVVRVPELVGTEPLILAQKNNADVGDNVLALGSPLGLQNTITTGIISGLGRDFTIDPYVYTNLYQISAPIAPGNSGGPLVHADTGEVLGINSAMASESNTIGFSIPVSEIEETVQKWSKNPMKDVPTTTSTSDDDADYDMPSVQDEGQYIVSYFYESLSRQDYVTAYSLLGSRWQSNLSYADFRQGYINTGEISIDSIIASKDGDQVKVTVEITAEERKDTSTAYSSYKLDYILAYENDILKILSGKGDKVAYYPG
jgi:serine protease Do